VAYIFSAHAQHRFLVRMRDIESKKLEKSLFYKYCNSRLYQNCYKILWKQLASTCNFSW